jgi:PhoPQ-activated pathogenicity-related protein
MDVGLVKYLDTPQNVKAMSIIDPANYWDRLKKFPKMITVTSDDEFMQMDWTQLYWDDVPGEKHLLISPNTEHVCVTGLPKILGNMGAFLRSIAAGHDASYRPKIE